MEFSSEEQPVLVEAWRGEAIENRYRGAACVVDCDGRILHSWGDIDALVYPRSSIKPIQAIPFLESGAAAAFGCSDAEIAMACASHSGELVHRDTVQNFLDRIGIGPSQLECGIHEPFSPIIAKDLIVDQREPNVLHHNCSGQHAAYLATAKHMGHAAQGYIAVDHPVQKMVSETMTDLCEVEVVHKPCGTDGCGVPTFAIPLRNLALGMARLADPIGLNDKRGRACQKIIRAMITQPYLVGGHDRFDTIAMEAGLGKFIVKTGAQGVYTASVPEQSLGIALKMESGDKEASETAILAILEFMELLDPRAEDALEPFLNRPILSAVGEVVGVKLPAEDFPAKTSHITARLSETDH